MHPQLKAITTSFLWHADATKAAGMEAYLLHQFKFFGLQTPIRRQIFKAHFKQYGLVDLKELELIIKEAWALPEREYQYFAIELYSFHKKLWNKSSIHLMQFCLINKSWWESVDSIIAKWLSDYFKQFPEQIIPITGQWNNSPNIWLMRSSILFQKSFKQNTDEQLLANYILHCHGSKEFFVQKAIGWSLREYYKTDPDWVIQFVKQHQLALSPLSKREGLKTFLRSTKNV